MFWLFATPWTAALLCSLLTVSRSLLKFMSIELVMLSSHLILCHSLLLLPSIIPSIRVFSSELALRIRWPKHLSFRFSISLSNGIFSVDFHQDWRAWFPCCSPRASQEYFPVAQFKSMNSLALKLFYCPTVTSVHDYWKKT